MKNQLRKMSRISMLIGLFCLTLSAVAFYAANGFGDLLSENKMARLKGAGLPCPFATCTKPQNCRVFYGGCRVLFWGVICDGDIKQCSEDETELDCEPALIGFCDGGGGGVEEDCGTQTKYLCVGKWSGIEWTCAADMTNPLDEGTCQRRNCSGTGAS